MAKSVTGQSDTEIGDEGSDGNLVGMAVTAYLMENFCGWLSCASKSADIQLLF